jgi:hypothetical protein
MAACLQKAAKLAKDEEDTIAGSTGAGLDASNIVSLAIAMRISAERNGLRVDSPLFAGGQTASHPPVDPGQSGGPDDDDVPFGN